jgi:hypothetical protein
VPLSLEKKHLSIEIATFEASSVKELGVAYTQEIFELNREKI